MNASSMRDICTIDLLNIRDDSHFIQCEFDLSILASNYSLQMFN